MNSISYIPLKAITNKKDYERSIFLSPYSAAFPYPIQRKKKTKEFETCLDFSCRNGRLVKNSSQCVF